MKVIKKQTKDENLGSDSVFHIPITKDIELQIKATFGFHVFIERVFNESVELHREDRKPLIYFIERAATQNNFIIPIAELQYIIDKIVIEWFGLKNLIDIKANHVDISTKLLYLVAVCHGGGQFGKKYLALRARYQKSVVEQLTETKALTYTNGNILH